MASWWWEIGVGYAKPSPPLPLFIMAFICVDWEKEMVILINGKVGRARCPTKARMTHSLNYHSTRKNPKYNRNAWSFNEKLKSPRLERHNMQNLISKARNGIIKIKTINKDLWIDYYFLSIICATFHSTQLFHATLVLSYFISLSWSYSCFAAGYHPNFISENIPSIQQYFSFYRLEDGLVLSKSTVCCFKLWIQNTSLFIVRELVCKLRNFNEIESV